MRNIFLLVLIFSFNVFYAQHNHQGEDHDENESPIFKHEPQHGGEVVDAGKYKLEIILNPLQVEGKLSAYLLKGNYKQMKLKDVTAEVQIKYKDGTVETIKLINIQDKLTGDPQYAVKPANYQFTLFIKGHENKAFYFYPGLTGP